MKKRIVVAGLIAAFAVVTARSAETSPLTVLPAGYRGIAVSLPGDQTAFMKKGDRVDALVTFDAEIKDKSKEKVTATILQNVLVLDIIKPAKLEEKGVVELVLYPNEAQYLALGLQQGTITLVLRAPGDQEMKPMEMAAFRKLFSN